MSTFYISDTHFGHVNIIKYSKRPFHSVQEMNECMIENWNSIVKPSDNVFHLGDFSYLKYKDLKDLLYNLNGFKMLILGNHDKEIMKYRKELTGPKLFVAINDYGEINSAAGAKIILCHYGMRVWNHSHHGAIHLYGHSHGTLPPLGKSVDVGVDAPFVIPRVKPEDYRPLHEDEILAFMKTRTFAAVDRHGEE